MTSLTKVFVSYAREDSGAAQQLIQDLREMNLEPWLDRERIQPLSRWEETLFSAISDSSYFIVLLSEHALTPDSYVLKEVDYALQLESEVASNIMFVLPLRLQDVVPDGPISQRQPIDLFPNWREGIEKLRRYIQPGAKPIKQRSLLFHYVGGAAVLWIPVYGYVLFDIFSREDPSADIWLYLITGAGGIGAAVLLSFVAGALMSSFVRPRSPLQARILGFISALVVVLLFIALHMQ